MLHHFTIESKDKNAYLTASNCIIQMDGKALTGVRSLKFEIDAVDNNIAKLTLELLCSIEIDATIDIEDNSFIEELKSL